MGVVGVERGADLRNRSVASFRFSIPSGLQATLLLLRSPFVTVRGHQGALAAFVIHER